jgi:hypothetical protein
VLCKDHGTEDGAFSTLRPGISEIRSHIATRQLVLKGSNAELEQFYQTFAPWINMKQRILDPYVCVSCF